MIIVSKKPPKKSDNDEKWRNSRKERISRELAPERHLIVTEGSKTEPFYFEGLRNEINRKYKDRIFLEIKGIGQGANTLTLLNEAEKLYDDYQKRIIEFQHIWLVFDKDDFKNDSFDNTVKKCQKLSDKNTDVKYHALWSNECVEYWFLLHFSYMTSALHRSQYIPKLNDWLKTKYSKNSNDIYEKLRSRLPTAINNAKKIMASYGNNANTNPSKCTPGTKVYEIFEYLKPYLHE